MKKLNLKSAVGLLIALGAGVAAFVTERDNQKKEQKIEDMENRITMLEQGRSE